MLPYGNFPVLTLLCAALPLSSLKIWGCASDVDGLCFWTAREPRGERADHLR